MAFENHILELQPHFPAVIELTHWGRVTHTCVGKLTIIGSDNGLSPGRRQAIIWTKAGILLIWSLGINFSEILITIETFSFKKMHLKILSAKWRPFCLGLNGLNPDKMAAVNAKFCILNKISLKFVLKGPVDNNPALVYIMAWHRIGDKPLSEPMLTRFARICAALGRDELKELYVSEDECEIRSVFSSFPSYGFSE